MPRYYFHLHNDIASIDEEGQELPNAALAHQRAIASAREMAAAAVLNGRLTMSHRIEVADEQGEVVATVYFRDAVHVEN